MLKDRKVGLLVTDDRLRTELYLLLVKAGAAVYPAESEAQLNHFLDHLQLDVLILAGKARPSYRAALN